MQAANARYGSAGRNVRRKGNVRRRRTVNSRFYIFAAALVVIIVLLIVLLTSNKKASREAAPAVTEIPAEITATTEPEPVSEPVEAAEPAAEQAGTQTETAAQPAASQSILDPASCYPDYTVLDGIPNTTQPLGVQECEMVDHSYFDDAVFVGDSVSLKLKLFTEKMRNEGNVCLGDAKFVVAGSMSIKDALGDVTDDAILPTYQGQKMHIEDAIQLLGSKKVYIMLGMNDISLRDADTNAQNMIRLLSRIKEKNPDATIFVQSCTPRVKGNYQKLNNNALFEYDLKLYEYCKQFSDKGIYFIDTAFAVRDEEGNLPENYCGDLNSLRLHFNNTACKIWLQYLYTHVPV